MASALPTPLEDCCSYQESGCCGVDCIETTIVVPGATRTVPGNPNDLGTQPTNPAVAETIWQYDPVSGAYITQWVWNPYLPTPQWA